MLESITLAHIVFLELIGALLLLSGILWYVLYRERKAHKELREQYERMCNTIRVDRSLYRSGEVEAPYSVTDAVAEHFHQCKQAAKRRYHAVTQNRLPRLSADAPFNAKIAALRYLYIHAEAEAYRNTRSSRDPWGALERHLYDITRWIVPRPEPKVDDTLQNRVQLLQKRIETLKPYEQRTRALKRSLQLARLKHERMEESQAQDQVAIKKLQKINRALKQSHEAKPAPHHSQPQLWQSSNEVPHDSNLNRMEEVSSQYQTLNRELQEGIRRLYGDEQPDRQNLESLAQRLAKDLEQSQRYINTLKKRLAHRQSLSSYPWPDGTGHPPPPLLPDEPVPEEIIEGALEASRGPYASEELLDEVKRLRDTNHEQRHLMVELERQLRTLSRSMEDSPDDETRDAKLAETQRLEETVQECRECITSLESEVDLLYRRLKAREESPEADEADPEPAQPLEQQTAENSGKLREALLKSRFDAIANQFAVNLLRTQSLDAVTDCLTNATKSAGLITGFYLKSALGSAEFYRSNQFSEEERQLIKTQSMADPITNLTEGIYFSGNHLHLLWKQAPAEDQARTRAQQFLETIVNLCSDRIRYLELESQLKHQRRDLVSWSDIMRDRVIGLKVRRAYQAEETLRQFKRFANQQQQMAEDLNLSPSTRSSLKAAISDCQSKMDQVVNGDGSLDSHCGQILEQLEALPRPSY